MSLYDSITLFNTKESPFRTISGARTTEPANYRGSYTTARKEIVDIEIAMYQSAGTLIIGTITIAARTIVTTMQLLWLLKLTVSQGQEEGGLRN